MEQPKEIILANDTPGSPDTHGILRRDGVMGRWWLLWGYSWLIARKSSNKLDISGPWIFTSEARLFSVVPVTGHKAMGTNLNTACSCCAV